MDEDCDRCTNCGISIPPGEGICDDCRDIQDEIDNEEHGPGHEEEDEDRPTA